MEEHLRAGAAIFNAGHYHAAHDAWEERWLDLEEETDDEALLHGLIQYTAVVHHGQEGNWPGAHGLAESGLEYLDALPDDYRGVGLPPIRRYLRRVARDPEHIERVRPPRITINGDAPRVGTLDVDTAFLAAPVLAEAVGFEASVLEAAVDYAETDLATGDQGSRFVALVLDFVHDPANRGTIERRLSQLVDRRQTREADVEDLF
ncbi:MAG: DUF309 domain-containing protein [Halobacteriaceae archaeon]